MADIPEDMIAGLAAMLEELWRDANYSPPAGTSAMEVARGIWAESDRFSTDAFSGVAPDLAAMFPGVATDPATQAVLEAAAMRVFGPPPGDGADPHSA